MLFFDTNLNLGRISLLKNYTSISNYGLLVVSWIFLISFLKSQLDVFFLKESHLTYNSPFDGKLVQFIRSISILVFLFKCIFLVRLYQPYCLSAELMFINFTVKARVGYCINTDLDRWNNNTGTCLPRFLVRLPLEGWWYYIKQLAGSVTSKGKSFWQCI